MTEEQKREYAEAIKAALGMEYGPPMEGEEGWVPSEARRGYVVGRILKSTAAAICKNGLFHIEATLAVERADCRGCMPGATLALHLPECEGHRERALAVVDSISVPASNWLDGPTPPVEVAVRYASYCAIFSPGSEVVIVSDERASSQYDWTYDEPAAMTVEDADDEDFDATAQAIMDELREKKERRLAEERAKAAEPKPAPPSDDPWAVIGKAEDDGEWIMKKVRDFG